MIIQRLTTLVTVTAFVSAIATPAVAQHAPHHRPAPPHGHPPPQASSSPPPAQASSSPPPADTSVAEARQEYNAGRQAMEAHNAEQALQHFQRAYELRSNPVVLIPIAEAQEQLGHIPDAIATLERYLHDRADAPDRSQREQELDNLRHRPATLHVASTPAGGHIFLDGQDTGQVTPADVPAQPGHRALRIELTGYRTASQDIDAAPGGRNDITQTLESSGLVVATTGTTTTTTTTTDTGGHGPGPVVWVATAVAAAGVIAGSVFGFMALSDQSDYNQHPTQDLRDDGETKAVLSDISFGVAILAAAVGVVVWLASDTGDHHAAHASRRDPHPRSSGPTVHFAPNGLMVNF